MSVIKKKTSHKLKSVLSYILKEISMPFEFEKLDIEDVILVKPIVFGDNRGFFMESYKKSEFVKNGIDIEFNQDNHSEVCTIKPNLIYRQNL